MTLESDEDNLAEITGQPPGGEVKRVQSLKRLGSV
jgi:hypothetical protein